MARAEHISVAANPDRERDAELKTIMTEASLSKQALAAPSLKTNPTFYFSRAEILSLIWLIGALFILILAARTNFKLWRTLGRASILENPKLR